MSAELSTLNLDEDLKEVCALPEASRWTIERPASLEVLVSMSPATAPDECFQARLAWDVYPDQPPSLKFRDLHTGRLDLPRAWPQTPGFRPGNLDACVPWTAEGMVTHPEWRNDPRFRWDARGNVLLKVLRSIQELLDDDYQGRHP